MPTLVRRPAQREIPTVFCYACAGHSERSIRSGGFSTIYRAVDAALGVRFAVKRLIAGAGAKG